MGFNSGLIGLKWILKKIMEEGGAWSGWMWFRVGTSGGLL
jgi:hypothetical protein